MTVAQDVNEMGWLRWLLQQEMNQRDIYEEAKDCLVNVCGDIERIPNWVRREWSMVVWLFENTLLCESLEEVATAIHRYVEPPREPARPPVRPASLPPGHTPPQGLPRIEQVNTVNQEEEMLRRLFAMAQQQGLLQPQNLAGVPQPQGLPQLGPGVPLGQVVVNDMGQGQKAPAKPLGCAGQVAYFITSILAILALYTIVNWLSMSFFHVNLTNEAKILWATKTDGVKLNKEGFALEWRDGEIVWYSHEWSCYPAFRYLDVATGQVLPPPSEWPAQDADQLLKQEFMGCIPNSRYQQWSGYWGDSGWGGLAQQDQEWLDSYFGMWNEATTGNKVEQKNGKWPDLLLWVRYADFGVKDSDFEAMGNTTDLSKAGATGQTGADQPLVPTDAPPTPTMRPQPTTPPYQPPPPADQPAAAPAEQAPAEAPPAAQPQEQAPAEAPAATAPPAPQPTVAPTQKPFATQTPAASAPPPAQPTMTDAQVQQALIDAKARLDAAQTAQANPPKATPVPTQVGRLVAPNVTPSDVVNPNPPCTGCHNSP